MISIDAHSLIRDGNDGHPFPSSRETKVGHALPSSREAMDGHPPSCSREIGFVDPLSYVYMNRSPLHSSRGAGGDNPLLGLSRGKGWPSSRSCVLSLLSLFFLEGQSPTSEREGMAILSVCERPFSSLLSF